MIYPPRTELMLFRHLLIAFYDVTVIYLGSENTSDNRELRNYPCCLRISLFDQISAQYFRTESRAVISVNMIYPFKQDSGKDSSSIHGQIAAFRMASDSNDIECPESRTQILFCQDLRRRKLETGHKILFPARDGTVRSSECNKCPAAIRSRRKSHRRELYRIFLVKDIHER